MKMEMLLSLTKYVFVAILSLKGNYESFREDGFKGQIKKVRHFLPDCIYSCLGAICGDDELWCF